MDRYWSIDDLMDANEALDIKAETEDYSYKQAKRKADRDARKTKGRK